VILIAAALFADLLDKFLKPQILWSHLWLYRSFGAGCRSKAGLWTSCLLSLHVQQADPQVHPSFIVGFPGRARLRLGTATTGLRGTQLRIQNRPLLAIVSAAALFAGTRIAGSQLPGAQATSTAQPSHSVCKDERSDRATLAALRLVCRQPQFVHGQSSPADTIVIGFVGGFTKADDLKRPEVLFAAYLRQHYSSAVHARVFSNHDDKEALNYIAGLLDTDHDGGLSEDEKRSARIIIYGHSWGASETAALARELGRHAIPVLLTVQLDIIPKPGQKPVLISPNVESAVNFYQPRGPLHGKSKIVASDPARTRILGNYRMTYGPESVNCDNYSWFVRTFNKPHHQIENDAHVWDQVASLIDSEVSGDGHLPAPSTEAGETENPSSVVDDKK
jgi:hypothetical protein